MTEKPPPDLLHMTHNQNQSKKCHLSHSQILATLHTFLENLDTPAFCLDTQYRYTCFNSHHAGVMKTLYNADIKIGGSLFEYQYIEEDRQKAKINLDRALAGEHVIERAYSGDHIRSRQFFEISHSPIREQNGEIIGVSIIAKNVTDLVTARGNLEKSDARLAGIISNSAAGIIYTDSDGNYLFANEAFCEMTGYSYEELKHVKVGDLVHPDDREVERGLLNEIKAHLRTAFRMELRISTKSGHECWGDLSVSAIFDNNNNPVNFIGVIKDITDKKRAESYLSRLNVLKEELLKSESTNKKLKKITDGIVEIFHADFARIWTVKNSDLCNSGCVFAQKSEGCDICTNREYCLHLNVSSGRYTHIDGDHRRIPMGSFKVGRIATGQEKQFITNDVIHDPQVSDHAWAESLGLTAFAGFRLLSQSLAPIGVLALFRKSPILPDEIKFLEDLAHTTSQILIAGEMDRALRENEEFLSSIIENIPNMLFVKDSNTLRFIKFNKAGEELLGYNRDDLIGKNDYDFFPKEEADFFTGNDRKVLSGQSVIDTPEEEILTRDKGKRILHTKKLPVFDEYGHPRYLLGISEDITEQKEIEAERDKLKTQLEYLLGATKTGIDIIDADFNLIYVDPVWSTVYGDYKGKKCYDYFNDLKSPCQGCGIPQALITRKETITEEVLSKEGGRIVEVHTIPFQDSHGDWFVAEFNIDVTERKRTQNLIDQYAKDLEYLSKRSVEMLDLDDDADIFAFIGSTIKKLTPAGSIVVVGKVDTGERSITARSIDGLERQHLELLGELGSSMMGRSYPLNDESIEHMMTGGLKELPYGIRTVSGNMFPEEVYQKIEQSGAIGKIYGAGLSWKRNLQGSVVIILPSGVDLSSIFRIEIFLQLSAIELIRRKIATELREERGLFIGGPIVVFKWEAREGWPVQYVSPNITSQFGYFPDDLIRGGIPYTSLIHPDDINRVASEVTRFSEEGRTTFEQEYRIKRRDGLFRWIYDFTVIEREKDGSIYAYHGYILDIDDRKTTEHLLRESEENARALINAPKESIFIMKPDGTPLYMNETTASRLGGSVEEIMEKSMFLMIPPDVAELRKQHINQVMVSGEPVHFIDERFGRVIENNLYPILGDNGEVSRIAVYGRDITEKQEMEESLRILAQISDEAPAAIMVHDFDGKMVYVNDEACRLHGYTREEYLSLNLHQLDVPESEQLISPRMQQILETGEADFDVRHYRKDGSTIPIHINAKIVTWGGKEVLMSIGSDLTERIHAEEEQKKILKLLNETQAVTKLGGWECDVLTGDISWTDEVYHIHGVGFDYDPRNIQKDIAFYTPEDALIIEQAFYRAVNEGVPYDRELKFIRGDGRQIWVRTIGNPVLEEGRVVRVTGNIMDITERKQLEISLREALQKLKVLTGITRHDVVNDLTAITLSLEIVLDAEDEETKHKYLFNALESAKILEKTINFTREYEDFGSLSGKWYKLLEILSAAKSGVTLGDIIVELRLSSEVEIFSDPIIKKVFTTLLENSVRHGGEKISEIRVFTQEKESNLVIVYEDNGMGIPRYEKDRIFDHGFGKHTGIGLFLAREILSITGLSIKECGVEGKGARFEILVPNGGFRYLS